DHRGDPDDDAQHGQQRAQLVGEQRLQRDEQGLEDRHRSYLLRPPPAGPMGPLIRWRMRSLRSAFCWLSWTAVTRPTFSPSFSPETISARSQSERPTITRRASKVPSAFSTKRTLGRCVASSGLSGVSVPDDPRCRTAPGLTLASVF